MIARATVVTDLTPNVSFYVSRTATHRDVCHSAQSLGVTAVCERWRSEKRHAQVVESYLKVVKAQQQAHEYLVPPWTA